MARYALKCLVGSQAGDWYRRRGTVMRYSKVKVLALLAKVNYAQTIWFATKYREKDREKNDADAG